MESAAENSSGAVNGFMGMSMAQSSGGVNVAELMKDSGADKAMMRQTDGNTWICDCGRINTLRFCPQCGKAKPEKRKCPKCDFVFSDELCGMKFCPNCGNNVEEC